MDYGNLWTITMALVMAAILIFVLAKRGKLEVTIEDTVKPQRKVKGNGKFKVRRTDEEMDSLIANVLREKRETGISDKDLMAKYHFTKPVMWSRMTKEQQDEWSAMNADCKKSQYRGNKQVQQ